MGSVAYGASDASSDIDIYGFCMPPKNILFPYSMGYIYGFGSTPERFEQFQKHHIHDISCDKEYDMSIYNVVKYFQLCMENNPNMVDSLFVPTRCILHSNSIGNHVRQNRHKFLSKKVYHSFKGYAFSQLHKMKDKYAVRFVELCKKFNVDVYDDLKTILAAIPKDPTYDNYISEVVSLVGKLETNGKRSKRLATIAKHGYDVKYAYHILRLLDECEQILETGDLDLTRSREQMKAIRRGDWMQEQVVEYFDTKNAYLEKLYGETKAVPYAPDEDAIRTVLTECIEMHYGSVDQYLKSNERLAKYLLDAQISIDKALKHV